jgi:hypothetical protein
MMSLLRVCSFFPASGALLFVLLGICSAAAAQNVTKEQLLALVPDEQDLQGFVRISPADERPPAGDLHFPAARIEDRIRLNFDLQKYWHNNVTGIGSYIERGLYSTDSIYYVGFQVVVCDSNDAASRFLAECNRQSSVPWTPGTFSGVPRIGDESWTHINLPGGHAMMFRFGRAFVRINASLSNVASRNDVKAEFPALAVEAVANMILLRLARHADLTGIPARPLAVAVNGKPLSGAPLGVGDKVFVSVAELAKAAGWKCAWDAKTGGLKLTKAAEKPITLAAGSASAKVADSTTPVTLKVPVLKESGQPVMELQDLVRLLKGKVVKREGGRLEVTL